MLLRRCLNNRDYIVEQEQARSTEVFLNSDYIANVQGERAESARLAFELQQARLLADFQQQQIEQAEEARQQSKALLQVLSRGYLDDIIASLSLSLALSPPRARARSLSPTDSLARDPSFSSVLAVSLSRSLALSLSSACSVPNSLFKIFSLIILPMCPG